MTVCEWVQTYLVGLLLEGFDAFSSLVVELFPRREDLDLIFESIAFRDQLEYTREIGTLLRGYLSCRGIRGRGAVSESKDGRCTKHSEVVCDWVSVTIQRARKMTHRQRKCPSC